MEGTHYFVDGVVCLQRMITMIMCGCHIGHLQPKYARSTLASVSPKPCRIAYEVKHGTLLGQSGGLNSAQPLGAYITLDGAT